MTHRVLWISAEPPDANGTGGQIRQARLLDALTKRSEVHLLVYGHVEDEAVRQRVASVVDIDAAPHPVVTSLWQRRGRDLFNALAARFPSEVRANLDARLALTAALQNAPEVDVVLVEHLGLAPILPAARRTPWAITLQNIASETAKQLATVTTGRRQRWLFEREQRTAAAFERWVVQAYDTVFTVSPDDAALLDGDPLVVPNGVDLQRFAPSPVPSNPSIVFTGHLAYLPNVDGVTWFCREVLPRVREQVPAAHVDIVGRIPVADVRDLAGPAVDVHADVETVAPYLASSRVAVIPLRLGSGTRLKALEAGAAGRPVVGTTVGLAGVPWRDGVSALIADDADSMARAIVTVLTDDAIANSLASEGRTLAEQFDWEAIGERFSDAVVRLAAT
ncbi:MAG: polysaccharide biosynthesis protein PslH [Acidimicrobiaceae bacterium]